MPDITDLLRSGAGDPLAPLDLDRVEQRGAQRGRNRRLTQAAVGSALAVAAVVGGVALASGGSPAASGPDQYAVVSAPDDVVPVDPKTDPKLQPTPAATKSELPDGNNFVLIKEVHADGTLLVDKVDRNLSVTNQAKCQQVDESYSYEQVFGFCWQNTNTLLRTVQVKADATISPYKGEAFDLTKLGALVAAGSPEITNEVWSVRVVDAVITSIQPASLY